MKRSRIRFAVTALAAVIALSNGSAAWGQPAPSASAESNALPPGHPATNPELPQGHPSVAGGDTANAPPNQPPPPGRKRTGALEDTVVDDSSLPRGVIVATVKDGEDRAIPRAAVKLEIVHNTVAKGERREELKGETDDQGTVRFDGRTVGTSTTYRVITTRGAAAYAVGPFALSDQQGKQVVLHSYEVITKLEDAPVGMQAIVYLQLKEDSISVEHLFNIINVGAVAWAADVMVTLPEGFRAFNKDDKGTVRPEEISGKGAALRGTVTPGQQDVTFRYQVPLSGDDQQTLHIGLPAHVAQARIMVESSKTMGLQVAGFPPAQKTQNRDGKRLLITEQQAQREAGGIKSFDITLTGLPSQGSGRWFAAMLAAVAILGAVAYRLQQQGSTDLSVDTREDLLDAREALLRELVELERAHRRGDVGPKTYERLRGALLDSLARIVTMLEGDTSSKRTPSKRDPVEGASTARPS